MQARFVSLAVGYALIRGNLRRKGLKQRPWLELRRIETESAYLGHQVKALRRAGGAGIVVDVDTVPGKGFYDIRRARIHHPWLERVMEILCPDGEQRISAEALLVAGPRGLASAWLDGGDWARAIGVLHLRTPDDARAMRAFLEQQGFPSGSIHAARSLQFRPAVADELMRQIRPHVHRSMRAALRPGSRDWDDALLGS